MTNSRINPPRQTRSQHTMQRVLDATESLLDRKSWQELTIQEVIEKAGTSVGAFYGRFGDKSGLLHALDERYFDRLAQMINASLEQSHWESMTLPKTLSTLADLVVAIHLEKQGLLRTLILQARLENDPRFRRRERRLMNYLPRLLEKVIIHRREIAHSDSATAAKFGFLQMFFTAREMLIWPHLVPSMPYTNQNLAPALAQAYLGYLRGDNLDKK